MEIEFLPLLRDYYNYIHNIYVATSLVVFHEVTVVQNKIYSIILPDKYNLCHLSKI